jgi:S-DNA-T family DNA segregation ATPase FtsK/SpoIIIE
LLALSLGSYDLRGGENWIGPVGESLASAFVSAFGLTALWLPVELGLLTVALFRAQRRNSWPLRLASLIVVVLVGCALLHLALSPSRVFGGHLPGGLSGEVLAEVMRSLLGTAGAYVICVSALLIDLVLRTSVSLVASYRWLSNVLRRGSEHLYDSSVESIGALSTAWREAKAIELAERAERKAAEQPKITLAGKTSPGALVVGKSVPGVTVSVASNAAPLATDSDEERDDERDEDGELDSDSDSVPGTASAPGTKSAAGTAVGASLVGGTGTAKDAARTRAPRRDPVIIAPTPIKEAARKASKSEHGFATTTGSDGRAFTLPPTSLLAEAEHIGLRIDEATLKDNAVRLVDKLAAYGVRGRVDEIHPGPVVTMYEFEPQSGTKVSKIAGLSDDLAMALAAEKVRIVAPIPGKARVGFELPNKHRQTVYLRELLEDERWRKLEGLLPLAFGKDIAGQPVFGDLSKMPHLLVAGATGSGKSVGLNVMLASLLMKKTPEQVRLLMIDPKVVELAVFDGIPHMLLPVVTDMKKASLALRWAVDEMERRYQLFADAGARNLVSYNARVDRVLRGELTVEQMMPRRAGKMRAYDAHGTEVLVDPDLDERPDAGDLKVEKLPSVVVVVDEFADLMMVAAKDVEAAIARLAQKARAAGIHVILATQRPSVDVITGMIKANFPSRIGFKVSQREDSKTILGRNGAEHLLGNGDMLALMPGQSDLRRVHCAFISEDEVKAVCDFLRLQGEPVYDDNILKPREDEDGDELGGGGAASDDPQYDRAVALVAQAGYCSISHIQRNLSIGYNKAAKLVERMEKEGVVGPASAKAGGRREVLVQAR